MNVRAWSFILLLAGAQVCSGQNFKPQSFKPESPEHTRLIPSIEGSDLYKAYCATCHGTDGKGAGPMAQELRSPVPDLTRIARRNHGKFPLERIERIISGEDQITSAHGSREMPMWGLIFSQIVWDQDLSHIRIHNLAKYLEQIQQ
jgi:mono/diheme cytochrome c family protein